MPNTPFIWVGKRRSHVNGKNGLKCCRDRLWKNQSSVFGIMATRLYPAFASTCKGKDLSQMFRCCRSSTWCLNEFPMKNLAES